MAHRPSAVCGTTCGCRYAWRSIVIAAGTSKVEIEKIKCTLQYSLTPFRLFSPKDAACADKNLLARSSLEENSIVAFPMTLASVYSTGVNLWGNSNISCSSQGAYGIVITIQLVNIQTAGKTFPRPM